MMSAIDDLLSSFVEQQNSAKKIFTPGPAPLLKENLIGLGPSFGRGDEQYSEIEKEVLSRLSKLTGMPKIVPFQGSASLALEMIFLNFIRGKVLVLDTGVYSSRLIGFATSVNMIEHNAVEVTELKISDIDDVAGKFDWVCACPVDTSDAFKIEIKHLRQLADRVGAKLMLDATASIGLENDHELSDVMGFSSCKGLFGLTGAAFIAHWGLPQHEVPFFYMALDTHVNKKVTGPYNIIQSLINVLRAHEDFRMAVKVNKELFLRKFEPWLVHQKAHQPLLCTRISRAVSASSSSTILYKSRLETSGSVVCHLGEVHQGRSATGVIQDAIHLD